MGTLYANTVYTLMKASTVFYHFTRRDKELIISLQVCIYLVVTILTFSWCTRDACLLLEFVAAVIYISTRPRGFVPMLQGDIPGLVYFRD